MTVENRKHIFGRLIGDPNIPPWPKSICLKGQASSFISILASVLGPKIIVFFESEDEAMILKEEIAFFSGESPYVFPPKTERLFEKDDESKRMEFLFHLFFKEKFVGLFPFSALSLPIPSMDEIISQVREVSLGESLLREELISYLEKLGYELSSIVREKGQYAKRGAIIDLFPPTEETAVRIEFLGDEILSIRSFDPKTQRSSKERERIIITPCKTHKNRETFFLDFLDHVEKDIVLVHKGMAHMMEYVPIEGKETLQRIFERNLNVDTSGIETEGSIDIKISSNDDLRHLFELKKTEIFLKLKEKISEWKNLSYLYIFTYTLTQAERLREILLNYDISLPILSKPAFFQKEREWGLVVGPLKKGFRTETAVFLTEEDIFGPKKRIARVNTSGFNEFLESFKDLKIGDYVVHMDHGIGIYRGIVEINVNGNRKDFLLIEYEGKDKLYVPVHSLDLVQKYIGGKDSRPKLDKLGSASWLNTKRRVKKKLEDLAKELIRIQAEREISEGYAYPPEDEIFREMESKFEYEETEGQLRAIRDVIEDLKKRRPMDRLVCGDVGFGKTEVAIRAAFKVAMEGKQVAVLVPTTILAQQHLKVFEERLKDYPFVIEMLSRFISKDKQREIVEQIKRGAVDIVIGTHRLLQKDIAFKDLGLLIIDEEHRFGVKAKERLKHIKESVDVLTLTATPIPRTLYMALSGIKDMSIIDTPPLDRLAVKTHVMKFNDEVIKRAIMEEIKRDGQVFFVHNYIHNIHVIYDYLKDLIPSLRIAVAHGKIKEKDLERIMNEFVERKYDLLLSTNIIESGLDISNVNTIIINNAHKFGLADLYQLRGRVGRGPRQAYAYLLVPANEKLTDEAILRLKIIEQIQDIGSGFHIANYDLELRGAGNILGKEQSGNINLVGYELYTHMLEEKIRELKLQKTEEKEIVPEIVIPVDAYIPETYVEDPVQKLLLYKRLSKVTNYHELEEIKQEIRDRYGEIPDPVKNLLMVISLKILLIKLWIKKIEFAQRTLNIYVTEKTPLNMQKILRLIKQHDRNLKILPEGRIIVGIDENQSKTPDLVINILKELTLCDI